MQMKKNWMSSSKNFTKSCLQNMTAADVGTVVRCTAEIFQKKIWGENAEYLGLTKEELINSYLIKKESENTYVTKHHPCDFLEEDGNCKLGEYKPENCRKYPYTDQPERLHSLYSVLETVEVCPIAFEIYERLKEEYGFRYRR